MQSGTVIGSSFIGFLCLLHIVSLILIIQMGPETWLIGSTVELEELECSLWHNPLFLSGAKVDVFPSAPCVRLTWIGLWCRGQVGTELLGSQRGIKDKPPRHTTQQETYFSGILHSNGQSFYFTRHSNKQTFKKNEVWILNCSQNSNWWLQIVCFASPSVPYIPFSIT